MIGNAFWSGFNKHAAYGLDRLPKAVADEIASQNVREGLGFLLSPVLSIAKRFGRHKNIRHSGTKKVIDTIKEVQRPFIDLDTEVGYHLDKGMNRLGIGTNLFKHEEQLRGGKDLIKKVKRTSALAPVSKATEVAKPIVFGLAAQKMIDERKKKRAEDKALQDRLSKSLSHG